MPTLVISVTHHDGRYHGRPDWPPSPARLFQALVAGAARGETLADEDRRALEWLESLAPPAIAAPPARAGQSLKNFVPNNDLDSINGDLRRIGKIRAEKRTRPTLFDPPGKLLYTWGFVEGPESESHAQRICEIAERLYQLGRGVDMACAWGEILNPEEAKRRTAGRALHRPTLGTADTQLATPLKGSLQSLIERYQKNRARFQQNLAAGAVFVQPPKPYFRQAAYDSPPVRLLFDLSGEKAPWPLDRVVELTEHVRDAATGKLEKALPEEKETIRRAIVGSRDATDADKAARVRIVPLPSIGHHHADHAIRRILAEIPPNCPLRADDLGWAFSALEAVESKVDPTTGEVKDQLSLTSAADPGMLAHYGVDPPNQARTWRTVTPAALPQSAARRRIDPAQIKAQAKTGAERQTEEERAAAAVVQSLRHAGILEQPAAVRVQREPFESNGARTEAFEAGARFPKARLWHVEIEFERPLAGPLIIGDGRFLGLGLMVPDRDASREIGVYDVGAQIPASDRSAFLHAVRRALMALSRDDDGNVPPLFSGHERDGGAARSGRHEHVFVAAADLDGDGYLDQLIVAAPWACDRKVRPRRADASCFDRILPSLASVRAGRLGVIPLQASTPPPALTGPAKVWESHTDYRPTRHAGRGKDAQEALRRDVYSECERRGLPRPEIEAVTISVGPREAVTASLRLRFAVAVEGPILLGRDSHQGGGLFLCLESST